MKTELINKDLLKEKKIYFIRNNIFFFKDEKNQKIDRDRTIGSLTSAWNKNYALIDYELKENVVEAYNPNSYKNRHAQSCIRRFNEFLKSGGFLIIASNSTNRGELKAGYVEPATEGKLISSEIGEIYSFKGVQLLTDSVKILNISKAPGLFSAIPRQQTFCEWSGVQSQFEFSYFGIKPEKLEIKHFHHKQLEVLCMEYLREKENLSRLTMDLGGSLANVDIVGIDKNGKSVMAQVTFGEKNEEKEKSLKLALGSNSKDAILYYFGKIKTEFRNEINFINIEDVFDFFWNLSPSYLYKMLGM